MRCWQARVEADDDCLVLLMVVAAWNKDSTDSSMTENGIAARPGAAAACAEGAGVRFRSRFLPVDDGELCRICVSDEYASTIAQETLIITVCLRSPLKLASGAMWHSAHPTEKLHQHPNIRAGIRQPREFAANVRYHALPSHSDQVAHASRSSLTRAFSVHSRRRAAPL
jgi:hypothetical protein